MKLPGGEIEDSCVLDGIMLNKDVTHSKMRRRIENPRIILVDCPLEYKKGESQINVEVTFPRTFLAFSVSISFINCGSFSAVEHRSRRKRTSTAFSSSRRSTSAKCVTTSLR